MFFRMVQDHAPVYLAGAMDSRTPTFRDDLYADYKAHRPPPPEDLRAQFPRVQQILEAYAIPVLQKDGFEADDVIATAVRRAREAGLGVVIVSGDKDLMQLVGEGVVLYDS